MIADLPPNSILWEGQTYSAHDWHEHLGITESDFQALIDEGVLRSDAESRKYRLDLVGFLFVRKRAFVVLPKIFRGRTDTSIIRDVISCIRTYRTRVKRRMRHAEASEILSFHDDKAKHIDLFLALVDWTSDRGFHSEDFESATDEPFDVNWNATMDHGIPLHIGKSVIYSEIVGRRIDYQFGALARLQARALLALHAQLKPVSLFWLNEHDPILDLAREINVNSPPRSGAFKDALEEVTTFLNVCNRDHDRELASILFDWLTDRPREAHKPAIFGTNAFHYVWEDICGVATLSLGSPTDHGSIASQPVYILQNTHKPTAGQKPDALRGNQAGLSILDAKWYDVATGDVPGVQDIVKQLMYELSIRDSTPVRYNAFLVPMTEKIPPLRVFGRAEMRANNEIDVRFKPVQIIGVSWEKAVSLYCKTSGKIQPNALDWTSIEESKG